MAPPPGITSDRRPLDRRRIDSTPQDALPVERDAMTTIGDGYHVILNSRAGQS